MAQNQELVAAVLHLLDAAGGPMGSSNLAIGLEDAGFQLSEATAGRLLRTLDTQGFTRKPGPKAGREITPQGRTHLKKIRARTSIEKRGAAVVQAVRTADDTELLDLLVARRAVEGEAARLAALHATDEELADIALQAATHVEITTSGGMPGRVESSNFHRSIVELSHSAILLSMAELLFEGANPKLAAALEHVTISTATVQSQSQDHVAIAQALLSRDGEAAAEATRRHLDNLMSAVHASTR